MFTERKDWLVIRRTLRAIRKHTFMLIMQIALAAVVTGGWYWIIWRHQAYIEREDTDLYLVGVFAFVSVTWVMIATELLRFVLNQQAEIIKAVKYGDRDTILDLKDDHIPLLLPFLLAVLALIVEGLVMSMPFKTAIDGCAAIFIVTLVFCFYGRIIYELEDPTEVGWARDIIERHDPTLLGMDVETVFARRWEQKKEEGTDAVE